MKQFTTILATLALVSTIYAAPKVTPALCKNFDHKLAKVDSFKFTGTIKPGASITLIATGEVLITDTINRAFEHEVYNGVTVKNAVFPLSHPYSVKKGDKSFSTTIEIPNVPLFGTFTGRFELMDTKSVRVGCVEVTVKF